ncbi:hypothetical protein QTP86_030312, partial [Hemibagrus guttatus]
DTVVVSALVDSGVAINLIDQHLVEELRLATRPSKTPLRVMVVDNRPIWNCLITCQTIPLILQFANFYRRFISNNSSIANPLTFLLWGKLRRLLSDGSLHPTEEELHHSPHIATSISQLPIHHRGGCIQLWNRGSALPMPWRPWESVPLHLLFLEANPSKGQLCCGEPKLMPCCDVMILLALPHFPEPILPPFHSARTRSLEPRGRNSAALINKPPPPSCPAR